MDSTAPLGKPLVDVGTACENDLHCIGNQERYRALLVIETPPAISAWRDGFDEAQARRLDGRCLVCTAASLRIVKGIQRRSSRHRITAAAEERNAPPAPGHAGLSLKARGLPYHRF